MGRRVSGLVALLAVALVACDDGDGGSTTPMQDMAVGPDRGVARLDAAPEDQGAGGEAADLGVEPDGAGGAGGQPDQGVVRPDLCEPAVGYGLKAALAAHVEGAPRYAPRTVWTGAEWGVLWQAPAEEAGINEVWFERFDISAQPIGEPLRLGVAKLPQAEITWTGTGYVAIWLSSRTRGGGIDGIKVQRIDTEGAASGGAVDVPGTFDVAHLDAAWAPRGAGMVVFTRGMAGAAGLFAVPLDELGTPAAPVKLAETETRGPSVAFGDGSWGVAWLDRASATPADLMFVVINDRGQPVSQPRRQADAGAQGTTQVAYGQGTFGVGWSKADAMGNLSAFVTLYDSAGDILATPPIPGARGFGLVTDVAWLDPDSFGVAWQDNSAQEITVGVTLVNTRGQVQNPVRLPVEGAHAASGMRLAGNVSKAGVWFVDDPTPTPGGGFSAQAHILNGIMGPCR